MSVRIFRLTCTKFPYNASDMNGAEIIGRFGGVRPLARMLGVSASTVQFWKATNRIPARHQQRILDCGRRLDPPLTPDDFFAAAREPGKVAA